MGKFASLKEIRDIAYSFRHGASVRKQWKDLVLAGRSELKYELDIYFKFYRESQTYSLLRGEEMQVEQLP